MVNVTISVPEEMKAEMDKYSEVNWSEVCRNAISRYLEMRKNPTPNIDLTIEHVELTDRYWVSGESGLLANILCHNKMSSEIIVDRALYRSEFLMESGLVLRIGNGYFLNRVPIPVDAKETIQAFLKIDLDKIDLEQITKTFKCGFEVTVYVEDFRNPVKRTIETQIPIDWWEDFVNRVKMKSKRKISETRTL